MLQIGQVYLLGLRLNLKPLWLGEGHRQPDLFPSLFQNFNCLFIFFFVCSPRHEYPECYEQPTRLWAPDVSAAAAGSPSPGPPSAPRLPCPAAPYDVPAITGSSGHVPGTTDATPAVHDAAEPGKQCKHDGGTLRRTSTIKPTHGIPGHASTQCL